MENSLINKSNSAPAREIGVITQEVRELCRQATTTALMYIVEIGRRLVEAKGVLEFGEWGKWLKEEVGFSQSTAENYMRLFEEYGASQITIFGATVDSQSFGKLPYSKALALLAVDKEDREKFAEEVNAESLSVKELKEVIRERDEARKRTEEVEKQLENLNAAQEEAKAAADEVEALKNKVGELEIALGAEKENSLKISEKLRKVKENPKIPQDKLDSIKRDAEDAAKKEIAESTGKALEEARAALAAAEDAKAAAEHAQAEAERNLAEARKKLKTASPDVNRFKTIFETLQEQAAKCKKQIEIIRESDPETAEKLMRALKAFGEELAR